MLKLNAWVHSIIYSLQTLLVTCDCGLNLNLTCSSLVKVDCCYAEAWDVRKGAIEYQEVGVGGGRGERERGGDRESEVA